MNHPEIKRQVAEYLDIYFPQFEEALKNILADNCLIKSFEPGDVLMQPGQYFKSTMLIVEGRIKLYREDADGHEFFIYYISPGNACALSMICATKQEKSRVLARTEEATTALLIPISLMDTLMQQYRSWYYFVLETYRSRFEELLEVIDNIAFRSMDERLHFYLKNQQEQLNTNELAITHQRIAEDLNSSREVISRLLKKMEQKGLLKISRNVITLWK
jgi:CRP/FNR family transcriptional regulator